MHGVRVAQPVLVEYLPCAQESVDPDGFSDQQPSKRHANLVKIGQRRRRLKAEFGEVAIIQVTTSLGGGGGGWCRPPTPAGAGARWWAAGCVGARQWQVDLHSVRDASLLSGHGVSNLLIC